MYKCHSIGSHLGRITGRRYQIRPGQCIQAPSGDLAGLPGVTWIGEEPEEKPPERTVRRTIVPKSVKSTSYKVRDVREMARHMEPDALREFIKDDHRKTVQKLLS